MEAAAGWRRREIGRRARGIDVQRLTAPMAPRQRAQQRSGCRGGVGVRTAPAEGALGLMPAYRTATRSQAGATNAEVVGDEQDR